MTTDGCRLLHSAVHSVVSARPQQLLSSFICISLLQSDTFSSPHRYFLFSHLTSLATSMPHLVYSMFFVFVNSFSFVVVVLFLPSLHENRQHKQAASYDFVLITRCPNFQNLPVVSRRTSHLCRQDLALFCRSRQYWKN